jgi:hypothetical protein
VCRNTPYTPQLTTVSIAKANQVIPGWEGASVGFISVLGLRAFEQKVNGEILLNSPEHLRK